MCGICGFITKRRVDEYALKKMNDTIKYRGPDDEGFYFDYSDGWEIGLAQRRLSVIDLSEGGHQPMLSDDNSIVAVYNGEIYNFEEIKRELIEKGYKFKSKSDTEVIVYGFKEWGIDCIKKFNGMFAVVIYDKHNKEIYFIRDRMGVKPLYYYYNNQDLVFGSELKPIMKYPFFCKEIDISSLNLYLAHQYIASPKTIFKHTYKLEPGEILKFKDGQISTFKYWDIIEKYNNRVVEDKSFDEHRDELEDLIRDSVTKRMIADVPVGTFLSGGIDSSLISALAQKNRMNPIDTFTIGFYEDKYNEANEAKEIAKILGTNHHEEYCSIKDAKDLIYDIPKYYDEPFADSSQLPTMLVSRIAKQKVTVALSGDGGDELFCGYNSYDYMLLQQKCIPLGKLFKNIYQLHTTGSKYAWKLGKLLRCDSEEAAVIIDYKNSNDIIAAFSEEKPTIFKKYDMTNRLNTKNIQEKRMVLDMTTYLPDDILTKVDRASMRYSLEARTPFLDCRVVEKSFGIPHIYKYNSGSKKDILKEILYKYVPKEIMDRPKKGFAIPLNKWLHIDLFKLIDELMQKDRITKQGLFDAEGIMQFKNKFIKNNTSAFNNIMWSLIVFQLWYDEYMK